MNSTFPKLHWFLSAFWTMAFACDGMAPKAEREWDMVWMNGTNRPVAVAHDIDNGFRRMEQFPIVYDITNYVNQIVADGTFCRIRGHVWGQHAHLTLEYRSEPYEERECKVCGRVEGRSMPEWPSETHPGATPEPKGVYQYWMPGLQMTNITVTTNKLFYNGMTNVVPRL